MADFWLREMAVLEVLSTLGKSLSDSIMAISRVSTTTGDVVQAGARASALQLIIQTTLMG